MGKDPSKIFSEQQLQLIAQAIRHVEAGEDDKCKQICEANKEDPLFPEFYEIKKKMYKLRDNNGEPTVVHWLDGIPEDEKELWAEIHKSGAFRYDDDGAYRYDDDEFLSYRRQDRYSQMTLSELKVENSAELSNGDGSEDKKPAATVNPVAAPPTPELSEDSNRKDTAPLLVSSPVARAAAPPATSAPSMTPTAFTTPARHGGLGQSGETETILRILSTVLEQQNTAAKAHAAELAEAAKTHAAQLAEAEKAHAAQLAEAEKAHAAQLAEAEKAHAAERAEDRNLVAHITNAHAAERAESEKAHAAQLAEAEKLLSEFAALMETYEKNRAEEIKAALTREAFARQGSAALSGVQVQASRTSQVEASTQRWTAPLTKQGNPCTKCKPERYCCDTHKQQHDF